MFYLKITNQAVKAWADEINFPGHIDFNDYYERFNHSHEEISITKEIISLLEGLDMNLLTKDDAKMFIDILCFPVIKTFESLKSLENY